MSETIEENVSKLFYRAYTNNEFYEYLVGVGDYLITFKDFANYQVNDMELMQKGINCFLLNNPSINVDSYINEKLVELLNSNDTIRITTVLDFLVYYVKFIKKENVRYNVDLDGILPLLREKIALLKQEILSAQNQERMWKNIENRCGLYEMRTGQKRM